jgi:hypothetical protein
VAIARGNGLSADHLVVGAMPPWLVGESNPAARALAEVTVRRALHPGVALSIEEPPAEARRGASDTWSAIVAAVAPGGPENALILRRAGRDTARAIAASRLAAGVAAELASARESSALAGVALDHARATVTAAVATLERLADDGWRSVLGDPPDAGERVRLGVDTVTERTESFDPLEVALATVG